MKGERVLTVEQNKAWESGQLTSLNISTTSMDNFANLLANGLRVNTGSSQSILPFADMPINGHSMSTVNNNSPNIHVEQNFTGITSENLMRDIDGRTKNAVQSGINEYNRQQNNSAKAGGVAGSRLTRR